ncbi:MAG: phosphate starvation-inducible protein PhoH [Candidatus Glassbacteria bacterium RIFCSPLOWO2_12_FULL_58_11]|uniref:PhoH-like protein n=1 Tax=Candidatus Glassbacteria bacterium RIFCSPLOWO2_12_FULL_58_11 TaxID=1817867 RepID=A0A1F5YJX1_9BACT|nr:MAG: phosphate starvation-inducible protein PhoH [Candidatus Glassbacteria bacterium RIFCSPLOWO2_12_FULL_58_11]
MVKATDRNQATRRIPIEGVDMLSLLGPNDRNLRLLETVFDCEAYLRGGELVVTGEEQAVSELENTLRRVIALVQTGKNPQVTEIGEIARRVREGDSAEGELYEPSNVYFTGMKKVIKARGNGQSRYLRMIAENDIVIGIGPAGTGKTYLAVAAAVDSFNKKRVKRIILARPAVEAGERLGFLPGDMQEKVDPYLRPLYDALKDMVQPEKLEKYLENGTIEIAPIAFMRGRTLHDAFVILDEAQNATRLQMKMFLTRLGVNSKAVITGDKTQIDLPRPDQSGLLQVEEILKGIDGIGFTYFTDEDVVRHRLVRDIVRAYQAAGEDEEEQLRLPGTR